MESKPSVPDEVPTFTATLIIRRFDPEVDDEPRWQDFDVVLHGTDRVLDALHKIKWEQDGSLTFRRSCAHGVCGSDAMRINGRNRLACKTLIKDLDISQPIYVEAIKGLPLEKDLIVDKEGVWRCRTTFNCTDACPRGIQVTQAIAEVKQAILRGKP